MFIAFHLEQFSEIRSVGRKVRAVQSTAMESIGTDGSSPPEHVAYKTNVQVETNSIPLQPLLVCLRILGIELVPSSTTEPSGKIDRCKTFTLGVIFLVFNAFCNVYTTLMNSPLFIEDFNTMLNSTTDGTDSTVKISTVLSWNIIIDYVNFGVLTVIVHATLLSLSQQSKWKSLWNNIQRMHQEFKVIRKTMGHLTIVGLAVVSFVRDTTQKHIELNELIFHLMCVYIGKYCNDQFLRGFHRNEAWGARIFAGPIAGLIPSVRNGL